MKDTSYDMTKFRITKLSGLLKTAQYLNKLAEADGAQSLNEDEISEMVARADTKLEDSTVETADNQSLKVMMVESLKRAAEEMATETPERVMPEDVQLKNLGEDSTILQQAATNPNARTDGVDQYPEVNVIETNLLSTDTGEGEKDMNETKDNKETNNDAVKLATLVELMQKVANEVDMLKEKVLGNQGALNQDDKKATETEDKAQENDAETINKLTKEDDIYESKTNDAEVDALVAAPEENTKGPEEIKGEGKENKSKGMKQTFANDKDRLDAILAKYKAKK